MSLLFDKNQQLDESELVDSLANKAPRSHKDMLIPQGFNPEIGDLATFVEHCERSKTTNNINMAKFYSSDEDSDTNKHKKRSKKFKENEDNNKKRCNKEPGFIALYMVKTTVTPLGSKNSSRKGLQIKTILNTGEKITRRISSNLISCRQKMPTKNTSMKS